MGVNASDLQVTVVTVVRLNLCVDPHLFMIFFRYHISDAFVVLPIHKC